MTTVEKYHDYPHKEDNHYHDDNDNSKDDYDNKNKGDYNNNNDDYNSNNNNSNNNNDYNNNQDDDKHDVKNENQQYQPQQSAPASPVLNQPTFPFQPPMIPARLPKDSFLQPPPLPELPSFPMGPSMQMQRLEPSVASNGPHVTTFMAPNHDPIKYHKDASKNFQPLQRETTNLPWEGQNVGPMTDSGRSVEQSIPEPTMAMGDDYQDQEKTTKSAIEPPKYRKYTQKSRKQVKPFNFAPLPEYTNHPETTRQFQQRPYSNQQVFQDRPYSSQQGAESRPLVNQNSWNNRPIQRTRPSRPVPVQLTDPNEGYGVGIGFLSELDHHDLPIYKPNMQNLRKKSL